MLVEMELDESNAGNTEIKMTHEKKRLRTWQNIVFGDCRDMHEIPSNSIHLVMTSPPYYNAPFDYPDLFTSYDEFLELIRGLRDELLRVLAPGRVAVLVTDDMLVKGQKYPIVADITRIMIDGGFRYRERLVWVKPKGYSRISRRSGVILQNPYPMYFYPDNIQESILIFQKGKFDYKNAKTLKEATRKASRLDTHLLNQNEWYLSVWNITNVLPVHGRVEEGIAAFPQEIPRRIIKLFTYVGETVLDPFLGSGTTMKVSRELGRNCWGYEIDHSLKPSISEKIGLHDPSLAKTTLTKLTVRSDSRRIRKSVRKSRA
jgi:DNA modification methylase